MRPPRACWKKSGSSARARRGVISRSMTSGRTTICSRSCTTIRVDEVAARMTATGARTGTRRGPIGAVAVLSCAALIVVLAGLLALAPARAASPLKAIDLGNDADRIDISEFGETHVDRGDTLQID